MPDINVQDEQGVTHVFPNEATPEMIAKVMGVKPPSGTPQASVPTEKEAAAAPPVPAPPLRAEMMNRGAEERTAQENMAPRARADILGHQVMSKSIAPVTNAMQALYPGAAIGAHYGAKALPYAWHSPYAAPVGAVAGAVLGHGVGSAAKGVSDLAAGATYEPPEKISLGPLGKINRNVPPNPYEEMGASAQYRDVARNAMKPPKAGYPFPGAQSSAPGATTGPPMPFTPPEGGPPVTATGPIPKMMPPRGYPGVESGSPTSGTPGVASAESRPTGTEEFLTNLVKKPIWTPEDSVDVRNAFGRDGLMRPGEGQTQYRARLMGMIRSSRAAQGMTDIESYPAPKRPR